MFVIWAWGGAYYWGEMIKEAGITTLIILGFSEVYENIAEQEYVM